MRRPDEEAVRELVGPFVDAGKNLVIRDVLEGRIEVSGKRRQQKFSFSLEQDSEGNLIVPKRRGPVPLKEHLASGFFADLDSLARGMLALLRSRLEDPTKVVDGSVGIEGQTQNRGAFDSVSSALYETDGLGTTVTLLHGDAGAGKSWLLMKIAYDQASAYLQKRSSVFPLYVDAQGINLRSIAQQIAHQLDLYNGILRYSEVTPLVRLGSLGLIIDGFDELIMPSGYNDTARALIHYLDEFKGEGALVASARTSFIHAYTDTPPKNEPSYPNTLKRLRLCPWTRDQRRQYIENSGRPDLTDSIEGLASASDVNKELLARPFLIAHVLRLLASGQVIDPDAVLEAVEGAFMERERTQKLKDPDTGKPLLSPVQFKSLLSEIAEEMWLLRQNSLDRQTARVVAALLVESFKLPRSDAEIVEARIDTHAFLESEGEWEDRVRFPHEIMFSRILAHRILEWLLSENLTELRSFLSVAPLKVSIAEQFKDLVKRRPKAEVDLFLERAQAVAEGSPRASHSANIFLNLGTIVAYLLTLRTDRQGLKLHRLYFSGSRFEQANLENVLMHDCVLQDVDARHTDWKGVSFEACPPITLLAINDRQEFSRSLPPVSQLRIHRTNEAYQDIYGTKQTRSALFGEPVPERAQEDIPAEAAEARELLESLCKKIAAGRHWFAPRNMEDDSAFRNLSRQPQWENVLKLLEKHGLLTKQFRSRSGPSAELYHVRRTAEILKVLGGDSGRPKIESLVAEIESLGGN